jgi:hypothetical protein
MTAHASIGDWEVYYFQGTWGFRKRGGWPESWGFCTYADAVNEMLRVRNKVNGRVS